MRLVRSPWTECFESLVEDAEDNLVISSPFVSRSACERLVRCIDRRGRRESLRLMLVTNFSLDNLVSGFTDAAAIVDLARQVPGTSIRFIPSLHAKVYIADNSRAVVTSANLTDGGLFRNLEYGVDVDDPIAVQQVRRDVEDYAALGPLVPVDTLADLAEAASRLAIEKAVIVEVAASEVRRTLQGLLESAGEKVLTARTAGRSLSAILQDTIVYLLTRGPLTTPEIHIRVQQIHPDLCDDSVERIIDGRSYGKRWKHSVRTAQSHLKEQGVAVLNKGRWRLSDDQPTSPPMAQRS